jgi:hypothetical protein
VKISRLRHAQPATPRHRDTATPRHRDTAATDTPPERMGTSETSGSASKCAYCPNHTNSRNNLGGPLRPHVSRHQSYSRQMEPYSKFEPRVGEIRGSTHVPHRSRRPALPAAQHRLASGANTAQCVQAQLSGALPHTAPDPTVCATSTPTLPPRPSPTIRTPGTCWPSSRAGDASSPAPAAFAPSTRASKPSGYQRKSTQSRMQVVSRYPSVRIYDRQQRQWPHPLGRAAATADRCTRPHPPNADHASSQPIPRRRGRVHAVIGYPFLLLVVALTTAITMVGARCCSISDYRTSTAWN